MFNFEGLINYMEIFWGSIFSSIISMILGFFFGSLGSYTGILIVTIWIGYLVSKDMLIGAFNGGLVGVFGGILSFMIMIIMWSLGVGPGLSIMMFGIGGIIIGLSINLIIGACGGAIGSAIQK
jgi:hypothetical protein